ncbi:MAG: response regulator transcription factor [Cyanobacteria bacterium REEB67]|nr:response regulator transcription factor [Cyanobacteria bacterium REEB67]
MAKLLLLEDDQGLASQVVSFLNSRGHTVEWVTSGEEAIDRLRLYQYDAAVFDWVVDGLDGRSACAEYRKSGGKLPILMLTGKGQVNDRLSGFDAGADDYLTKPFVSEELLARLRAILRRPSQLVSEILELGELQLNLASRTLLKGSEEISLMPKEFIVLEYMMRNRNRIFSAEELLERLWSSESDSTEAAVRKCLTRLRSKIDGANEIGYLSTVKGFGYKLAVPKSDF